MPSQLVARPEIPLPLPAERFPNPEIEQARCNVLARHRAREIEIREVIAGWCGEDSAGSRFLTCLQWQAILQVIVRAFDELAERTPMLRANYSANEFIDEVHRLTEVTYGMCVDLWYSATANKRLERHHRGLPTERSAEAAGLGAIRTIWLATAEQMIFIGRPAFGGIGAIYLYRLLDPKPNQSLFQGSSESPAVEQASEPTTAPTATAADWRRRITAFQKTVFRATGCRISRKDIDRVAGYEQPTTRKNLGTLKQTAVAAANFADVLTRSPDEFVRLNTSILKRSSGHPPKFP